MVGKSYKIAFSYHRLSSVYIGFQVANLQFKVTLPHHNVNKGIMNKRTD